MGTSPAGPEVAMNTSVIPLSPCNLTQPGVAMAQKKEGLCCGSVFHGNRPYLCHPLFQSLALFTSLTGARPAC